MVDVRDMLCAQALAVVSGAVKRSVSGQSVDVCLNSADVRQDLLAWAQSLGHETESLERFVLRIRRKNLPREPRREA